jgi:hypothetical protein
MRLALRSFFLVLLLAAPVQAQAQALPGLAGYDGRNPFNCKIQKVGEGVDFPDPDADPFCVDFEKRHQNVTQLGVVGFLLLEPARVAAASPKCFYFQRDRWRGSVQQDVEATETYAWNGRYFFDKARGVGGVYVDHFTFNNQTSDPRQVPGFPNDLKPFFGPGKGGIQSVGGIPVDPRCVALAQRHNPYARHGSPPGGGHSHRPH